VNYYKDIVEYKIKYELDLRELESSEIVWYLLYTFDSWLKIIKIILPPLLTWLFITLKSM